MQRKTMLIFLDLKCEAIDKPKPTVATWLKQKIAYQPQPAVIHLRVLADVELRQATVALYRLRDNARSYVIITEVKRTDVASLGT